MSLFKEKNILFETMYFKGGDIAGSFFLKNIIDNLLFLENRILSYDYVINSIDDVFDYLWFVDFKEMSNEIDIYKIDDQTKNRIKDLSNKIIINIKALVNFINSNPEIVFTEKNIVKPMHWHIYLPRMMSFCFERCSSSLNQNIFDFIEDNLFLNILSSFDICYKYYQKHKNSFKKLFNHLKDTKIFDDQVYVSFLMQNSKMIDPQFLSEQANFICKRAYKTIVESGLDSDKTEIMQTIHLFDKYYELACFYKLQCSNDFTTYKPKIEACLNEYVVKHGQHIDIGPINLKPILDIFEKSNDKFRFFQLTHSLKDDKYNNNFNKIFETKPHNRLTEFFPPRGKSKSDKYPFHKQEHMDLMLSIDADILNMIICHQKLSVDFSNYLLSICVHVQTNYFKERINIFEEIGGCYEVLNNLHMLQTKKQTKSLLYKALCNGCCVNLCGTIEKIIRNVVLVEESSKIYIDEKKLTLGQLLDSKFKLKSLSDGLKYYLNYFLLTDIEASAIKEQRPGKDIRNWQMHNANDKYDKTDFHLCLELFYLTISLVVDLVFVSLTPDDK